MSRLETPDHQHDPEEEELVVQKPAFIFDAEYPGEPVPDGFDSVRILLNGKIKSDLSWKKEEAAAKKYSAQGYRLFWEIDLGLYHALEAPISNQTQFFSLCLSLEHFRDTLWRVFRKDSIGLSLYRGPLDYLIGFPWDEEQTVSLQEWIKEIYTDVDHASEDIGLNLSNFAFITPTMLSRSSAGRELIRLFCRNVVTDYLSRLASTLPDTIPLFALLDTGLLSDSYLISQLLIKERYPIINIGVKGERVNGKQFLGGDLGWEGNQLMLGSISRKTHERSQTIDSSLGVCLPGFDNQPLSSATQIRRVVESLTKRNVSFRIIPESRVLTSLQGLERLIVDSGHVDRQLYRVLQGFAAAGGTIAHLGNPIGISGEERYSEQVD